MYQYLPDDWQAVESRSFDSTQTTLEISEFAYDYQELNGVLTFLIDDPDEILTP